MKRFNDIKVAHLNRFVITCNGYYDQIPVYTATNVFLPCYSCQNYINFGKQIIVCLMILTDFIVKWVFYLSQITHKYVISYYRLTFKIAYLYYILPNTVNCICLQHNIYRDSTMHYSQTIPKNHRWDIKGAPEDGWWAIPIHEHVILQLLCISTVILCISG